jgi:hypothetical protein
MVADCGSELSQADRKIGVFHLPGEGLLQTSAQATRTIDIPDMARYEQRGKEGEAAGSSGRALAGSRAYPKSVCA